METIETMYEDFMNTTFEIEGIPMQAYSVMRRTFYAGFSRACMVYEKELPEMSEELAEKEKRLLKEELKRYVDMLRVEVGDTNEWR